jgi:hypothetical protein
VSFDEKVGQAMATRYRKIAENAIGFRFSAQKFYTFGSDLHPRA